MKVVSSKLVGLPEELVRVECLAVRQKLDVGSRAVLGVDGPVFVTSPPEWYGWHHKWYFEGIVADSARIAGGLSGPCDDDAVKTERVVVRGTVSIVDQVEATASDQVEATASDQVEATASDQVEATASDPSEIS
eukprot:GHVO01050101.1.p1 GENE.GHVO01050101.1~~GHVO01050101.1.p1  ORF type:complete len:134 (+),score=17.85 GHVO01050101.1:377-778(+)